MSIEAIDAWCRSIGIHCDECNATYPGHGENCSKKVAEDRPDLRPTKKEEVPVCSCGCHS